MQAWCWQNQMMGRNVFVLQKPDCNFYLYFLHISSFLWQSPQLNILFLWAICISLFCPTDSLSILCGNYKQIYNKFRKMPIRKNTRERFACPLGVHHVEGLRNVKLDMAVSQDLSQKRYSLSNMVGTIQRMFILSNMSALSACPSSLISRKCSRLQI